MHIKTIVLSVIAVLAKSFCFGQLPFKTFGGLEILLKMKHEEYLTFSLAEQNLKGKIKSVVYYYNGHDPVSCFGASTEDYIQKRILNYDTNGNLIEAKKYMADGRLIERIVNKYTKNKIVVTKTFARDYNPWGGVEYPDHRGPSKSDTEVILRSSTVRKYNSIGDLIEERTYSPGDKLPSRIVFIYHSRYNWFKRDTLSVIEKRYYDQDGTLFSVNYYQPFKRKLTERGFENNDIEFLKHKKVYEFDTLNREISINHFLNDSLNEIFEFSYDERNNLTRSKQTGGDIFHKDYKAECVFTYDTLNNLTNWDETIHGVHIESNTPSLYTDSKEIKYEGFDANLNWLKKSIYRSGKYIKNIERTITYYKP